MDPVPGSDNSVLTSDHPVPLDDRPESNNTNGLTKQPDASTTDPTKDAAKSTPHDQSSSVPSTANEKAAVNENGAQPSDEGKAVVGDIKATNGANHVEVHERNSSDNVKAEAKERDSDSRKASGRSDREKERQKDDRDLKDKHKHRSRDRDSKDKERDRKERKRSRSRSKSRSRKASRRSRDKSRDRSRSRNRTKSKKRSHSRSRSRDRRRRHKSRSRSKSRDRRRGRKSPSRARSESHRKDRSQSPGDNKGRSRRSSSADYGGYVPRRRHSDMPIRPAPPTNADPFFYLRQSAPVPNDPQEAMRLWQEQQLRSRQLVLQQQAASAAAAASKTQREVYVGNLAAGMVTEQALKQVFNSALIAAYPAAQVPGMDPVVNVSMHSDGRYAFVELRTPEMATAALQLSGQVQLLGQAISVGRPSGYVDPAKAALAAQQAAAALAAFTAGDASAATLVSPAALTAKSPSLGLTPGTPGTPGLSSAVPTTCLCVIGMVTQDVLVDDQEYADVIDDLKDECGKYGIVEEVRIPRPSPPSISASVFGQGHFGKAFVKFADIASAERAREAVHGRMFAGSIIQALFVTEDGYQKI